jgi:CRP/FNR family cyclic AMP-dependent transcriptional regulator
VSEIQEVLRRLRILDGLDEEHLVQLADVAEQVQFAEGEVIFREGDPATDVYLIVDGSVSLEVCAASVGCRRILTITEGELLGWSPVLDQTRLSATARALEPTRAVRLNGKQVLAQCEHNPRFGYEFMRRAALALANRLNATRLQLLNVYGSAMPTSVDD